MDVPAHCVGWALGAVIFITHFYRQFVCTQFCYCAHTYANSIICLLSILRGQGRRGFIARLVNALLGFLFLLGLVINDSGDAEIIVSG